MEPMALTRILFLTALLNSPVLGISTYKWPSIGISILVRNKAHTLPYFLSCIESLKYPKDRIYIWIYSDYNQDISIDILEKWSEKHAHKYNGVYITSNKTSGELHPDEERPTQWSTQHFSHVISLREQALNFARKMWADYLFMVDADVFITNPEILKILVQKDLPVVAPMLTSDGIYSNFWCGMTDNYYYRRTDEYKPILNRDEKGCFQVPMIHTAVLISLRDAASDHLTYVPGNIEDYDGPDDDIIAFAVNAKKHDIQLSICNDHIYGFIPVPLDEKDDISHDLQQLLNIKLEAISQGTPLPLLEDLQEFVRYPEPSKLGFDEIFMINLERRPERRRLMELTFKELGMNVTLFKAVDGREINMDRLSELSITLMPDYEDPYHGRPMTAGEVGCFLSHYYIWKEIVRRNLGLTLILEDDVRFESFARRKLRRLLSEASQLEWDLLYLGRKILESDEEILGSTLAVPGYSYWTLAYVLRGSGAKTLLRSGATSRLLPVDEFLPIMFDRHPNATWKAHFPERSLVALSAAPLLAFPTHYTGEPGHLSDTEPPGKYSAGGQYSQEAQYSMGSQYGQDGPAGPPRVEL